MPSRLPAYATALLCSQIFCNLGYAADSANPKSRSRKVASDPKITSQTTTRELPVEEDQSGTGLALFLGAGGTAFSSSPFVSSRVESAKSGFGYQGRAGLTFTTRALALELGAGWMQSNLSGPATTAALGNTTTTTATQINTKAGFVDFSPRLRLGELLEIGPMASVFFGTNASFGATKSQPDSPVLAGLRLGLGWQTRTLQFRVSAQGQSTLTIPERRVLLGSLGFEVGIPLVRGKTVVRETETKQIEERIETEYIETEVPVVEKVEVIKEVVREVMLFSFDDQVVHFEFDRAELTPASREFVSQLGQFLSENPTLWSSVRIDGHTDSRGSEEYNLKLSDSRARNVLDALASAGIASEKLASRGMGMAQPLDRGPSDLSRARNRRVELSFVGVTDSQALRDGVNRIRMQTSVPRTCGPTGKCR